jgi:hypothetical protein
MVFGKATQSDLMEIVEMLADDPLGRYGKIYSILRNINRPLTTLLKTTTRN